MQYVIEIIGITRGPWTAMPALIKVKETDKIDWHFYMGLKVFQNWSNFMGKACWGLEISIKKPENSQLSNSFKEDVRGLAKLNAA